MSTPAGGASDQPLEFRQLLAEAFSDAEQHGLGTFQPGFTAAPGRNAAAADFIGARVDHLLDARGYPT